MREASTFFAYIFHSIKKSTRFALCYFSALLPWNVISYTQISSIVAFSRFFSELMQAMHNRHTVQLFTLLHVCGVLLHEYVIFSKHNSI